MNHQVRAPGQFSTSTFRDMFDSSDPKIKWIRSEGSFEQLMLPFYPLNEELRLAYTNSSIRLSQRYHETDAGMRGVLKLFGM